MTGSPVHPWFLEAGEHFRWTGTLEELWNRLLARAHSDTGCSPYFRLPRGAEVALRIRAETMRKELRIARAEPARTEEQEKKWGIEVQTFLKHFPAPYGGSWYPVGTKIQTERGEGVAGRFLQLWKGEIAPGKGRCQCGTVVEYDMRAVDQQRCARCAQHAERAALTRRLHESVERVARE